MFEKVSFINELQGPGHFWNTTGVGDPEWASGGLVGMLKTGNWADTCISWPEAVFHSQWRVHNSRLTGTRAGASGWLNAIQSRDAVSAGGNPQTVLTAIPSPLVKIFPTSEGSSTFSKANQNLILFFGPPKIDFTVFKIKTEVVYYVKEQLCHQLASHSDHCIDCTIVNWTNTWWFFGCHYHQIGCSAPFQIKICSSSIYVIHICPFCSMFVVWIISFGSQIPHFRTHASPPEPPSLSSGYFFFFLSALGAENFRSVHTTNCY
jgi:hypothetical protein